MSAARHNTSWHVVTEGPGEPSLIVAFRMDTVLPLSLTRGEGYVGAKIRLHCTDFGATELACGISGYVGILQPVDDLPPHGVLAYLRDNYQ